MMRNCDYGKMIQICDVICGVCEFCCDVCEICDECHETYETCQIFDCSCVYQTHLVYPIDLACAICEICHVFYAMNEAYMIIYDMT